MKSQNVLWGAGSSFISALSLLTKMFCIASALLRATPSASPCKKIEIKVPSCSDKYLQLYTKASLIGILFKLLVNQEQERDCQSITIELRNLSFQNDTFMAQIVSLPHNSLNTPQCISEKNSNVFLITIYFHKQ